MPTSFRGAPGVYPGPSLNSRNIFVGYHQTKEQVVPSFKFVDGPLSRDTGSSPTDLLRAGLLVGKVTATGKYRPSVLGLTSAAATNGATSLTVNAAVATEVARLIAAAGASVALKLVGPPTAAGTVAVLSATASAASGTTITVGAIGAALAAGSFVAPGDGAHVPVTPLVGPYPICVTGADGSYDEPIHEFLRGADLRADRIVNLVADDFGTTTDTSVQAWAKAQLRAGGGSWTFDNDR